MYKQQYEKKARRPISSSEKILKPLHLNLEIIQNFTFQMTCSAVGMFIAMATFATFEYIKQYHTLDETVGTTFQVISSFSYILLHSIGFQVIAMILLGELCPVKLKSLTSGIVISIESILAFGVVKIFPIALGK